MSNIYSGQTGITVKLEVSLENELEKIKTEIKEEKQELDIIKTEIKEDKQKMDIIKTEIEQANAEFSKKANKLKKIKQEIQEVKNRFNIQDTEVQNKLDEMKEKINDQFTRLQPWLNRLGGYLVAELTDRNWENVPSNLRSAPSLWID